MVSEVKLKAKNKTSSKGLKTLTPKQMLQRLLIKVKAGNNSESLLNEIRHKLFIFRINQKKSLKKYITT